MAYAGVGGGGGGGGGGNGRNHNHRHHQPPLLKRILDPHLYCRVGTQRLGMAEGQHMGNKNMLTLHMQTSGNDIDAVTSKALS